ncbi:MAG TPA: hypothetical protein V6C46_08735 [Coleofasciculaceae cyanobacterium]
MKFHIHGPLFRFSVQLFKYYLLFLFSFTVACLVSWIFGAIQLVNLLTAAVGEWLIRVALLLVCMMGISIVVESLNDE